METPHSRPLDLRRVAVVGTSCSGKTVLARDLSAVLEAPHVELDALFWQPGWVERPLPAFRSLVDRATSAERWVADGNYSAVRDLVWGRATDIIWLNYPLLVVWWRALSRTVVRALTREELFSGNRESLRQSFLTRDSILLWVARTYHQNRRKYAALRRSDEWKHLRFRELRHPADAAALLSRCRAAESEAENTP